MGSVAEMKSERIALRASREQNGAVAFVQVTKRHRRWAVIDNAADAPLGVPAGHRSGVKVGGSVVEEIGLAGTRVALPHEHLSPSENASKQLFQNDNSLPDTHSPSV